MNHKIKIVAEIGCNHNGKIDLAKKMIEGAKKAGADAVKFQSFIAEELVSRVAPKAEYQQIADVQETQLDMIKKLELSHKEYMEVKLYAEHLGIEIFATAFDEKSIDFLYSLGQKMWKIPSGEITNLPYIEKIRDLKCKDKEIILSTGMSNMDEISFAVKLLSNSENTTFTILHCNTEYPTCDEDMNLRALFVLKSKFPEWHIGLSDHSKGTVAAVASAAMGIKFIEKHFTLDKLYPGPDHMASIDLKELYELCFNIRRTEKMLGKQKKFVTDSERKNKFIVRKSIVARKRIKKGEAFTSENITCKRPGNGISPMHWYEVLGIISDRDYNDDELIKCEGFQWVEDNEKSCNYTS